MGINNNAVLVNGYGNAELCKFFRHGGSSVAFLDFKASCSGKNPAAFNRRNGKKYGAKIRAVGNVYGWGAFSEKGKVFFINFVTLKAFRIKAGYFDFASEFNKCGEKGCVGKRPDCPSV